MESMPIRAANKAQQSVRAESARHALHMILSYIGAQETREPGQSREHEGARNGEDGHADREDDGLDDPGDAPVLGDDRADHLGLEGPVSEHGQAHICQQTGSLSGFKG